MNKQLYITLIENKLQKSNHIDQELLLLAATIQNHLMPACKLKHDDNVNDLKYQLILVQDTSLQYC